MWWFTLSFGCPHTVLGRCSRPHYPTIMYHLSIKSPDVSFLHAVSGLVDYIFLTLCGWVSGRVTYGRHPRGVTFFGIIYSNVWMTPFSDEDFQPWKHLTRMHCESHGESLFLSVAHIRPWEYIANQTPNLLMIPFSTRYIWHGGGWLYISDTVCGWVSGRVYLWHPVRGYLLQHSFCHPMQGLL